MYIHVYICVCLPIYTCIIIILYYYYTTDKYIYTCILSCMLSGMSMLDFVSTDNDPLSLSNVFKHWLMDCSTDSEHLHLSLPACLGDTPLTLKCDLYVTIIDPQCLSNLGEIFVRL